MPSALAKDEYIPAGAIILAWQDEPCRPPEGAVKPYGTKDTRGWVNAYYLLTSDGVRMGEGFALNQENDGTGATMRGR
jgi:hypothetical protein